jgi:hypothetical protein
MEKRKFNCAECGDEFEVEADHFIPGISGTIVTSDGVKHTFIDPTEDHLCPACEYIAYIEAGKKLMALMEERRKAEEHGQE